MYGTGHDLQQDASVQLSRLREHAARRARVSAIATALYWDERVNLPEGALAERAAQRAWLSSIEHELRGGDEARAVLAAAEAWDADHPEVRAMRRVVEHGGRVPAELVARTAEATLHAHHAWHQARASNDVSGWLPHLRTLIGLAREEAAALDGTRDAYAVLVDRWEPGAEASEVARVLERLADHVAPMVHGARDVDTSILDRPVPDAARRGVERDVLASLGFDWTRGRIDGTARAFCVSLGPGDVRLTTRLYDAPGLRNLRCSMHEAGHGIYAQALHRLELPATIADAAGLGLDESQSRMFERRIGASPAFWSFHYPRLVDRLPEVYAPNEHAAFEAAMRAPDVNLLRIDSGEAAYNLHVLLRMRIERALIDGSLDPVDLPGVWNEQVRELLGLVVPDDVRGCLQDVHWSIGQWGYFPTYALGNIYAAQLLDAARVSLDVDLDAHIARTGDTAPLIGWLDEHVYAHGCAMTSAEIVEAATGSPLDVMPLVRHLGSLFA